MIVVIIKDQGIADSNYKVITDGGSYQSNQHLHIHRDLLHIDWTPRWTWAVRGIHDRANLARRYSQDTFERLGKCKLAAVSDCACDICDLLFLEQEMPRCGANPMSREPALWCYACCSNEASREGRARQPGKLRQRRHTPGPRGVGQHHVDRPPNEGIANAMARRIHQADCSAAVMVKETPRASKHHRE